MSYLGVSKVGVLSKCDKADLGDTGCTGICKNRRHLPSWKSFRRNTSDDSTSAFIRVTRALGQADLHLAYRE